MSPDRPTRPPTAEDHGRATGQLRWRVWYDFDRTGPENMAVDHALAECLRPGEAVLRLYGWSVPTISLGRNQTARDRYDLEEARKLGIAFVRRPTGGRAVLHDRELTYAAVFPRNSLGGPRSAYGRLNRGLATGLGAVGAALTRVERGEAAPPVAERICFDAPATGELVADGGKVIGSAQARLAGVILQHGSLLLVSDQSRLAGLTLEFSGMSSEPVTLERHLGRLPDRSILARALAEGIRDEVGGRWAEGGLRERERSVAAGLVNRYRSHGWTWRR